MRVGGNLLAKRTSGGGKTMLVRAVPPMRDAGRLVGRAVVAVSTVAVAAVATLETALLVLQPEHGLPGLAQIVAPHLALAGLAFAPLAIAPGTRGLRITLLVLAAVAVIRFGGEWVSWPSVSASGSAGDISVTTWNLEVASRPPVDTVASLHGLSADVVVVQELRVDVADAIAADPVLRERYPHRALVGRHDVSGMGTLSRFPILEQSYSTDPMLQTVVLETPLGRLSVLNGHAFPPRGIDGPAYDPSIRSASLRTIRAAADARIAAGERVVLAGDFNVAPTEPAFGRFTAGLADAHAAVGSGPGWTWRPSELEWLGIALLRIDHVVVGPGLRPVETDVACPVFGDHCRLRVEVGLRSSA